MNESHRICLSMSLALILGGCAQLGGKEGGGENLPNRGINQYESVGTLALSTPSEDFNDFSEPTALLIDSKIHLYVQAESSTNPRSIFVFISEDDGQSFSTGIQVANAPEGGAGTLKAPSVACLNQQCILAASVGESGSIYLADGPPQGPFTWRPNAIVEPVEAYEIGGIHSPSVVLEQNTIKVYYAARPDPDGSYSIAGGELSGNVFERWGVLLSPETGCVDSSGSDVSCWNEKDISAPEVRKAQTGTGRTIYRMLFNGNDGASTQVGFAASFDGRYFESYEFNPVLSDGETQVSNIRVGDSYLMYYVPAASWDAGKIGLSINGRGNATETF